MDEISKGFFWIPDFRHIFPIFDTLYGRPFVFRFTFLKVARKFAPPANLPGKGPAEEVAFTVRYVSSPFAKMGYLPVISFTRRRKVSMSMIDELDGEVSEATRKSSREKQPNVRIDPEEMESEHIQRIKNSKRGHLSTVTSRKNEITDLISDDTNLKLVKEKLQTLSLSFIKYSEVHQAYQDCEISFESKIAEQNQYETEELLYSNFAIRINEWISEVEFRFFFQPEISPQDSVRQVGMNRSDRSSICSSSARIARLNDAARKVELEVEIKSLKLKQQLEQQKLQLRQEEERFRLETEITKHAMKESVSTRSSCSRTRIEDTKYRTEEKIIPLKIKLPQPPLSQPFEPMCSPKDEQQTRNLQSEQVEQLVSENNPLIEFMLNLQTQQNNLNQRCTNSRYSLFVARM